MAPNGFSELNSYKRREPLTCSSRSSRSWENHCNWMSNGKWPRDVRICSNNLHTPKRNVLVTNTYTPEGIYYCFILGCEFKVSQVLKSQVIKRSIRLLICLRTHPIPGFVLLWGTTHRGVRMQSYIKYSIQPNLFQVTYDFISSSTPSSKIFSSVVSFMPKIMHIVFEQHQAIADLTQKKDFEEFENLRYVCPQKEK